MQKLLSWAKQHVSWTKVQWDSVIFSDESKFNLHGSDGKQYVRRHEIEAYHLDCISPVIKLSSSQIVWGYICSNGVGRLKLTTRTVNTSVYTQVLDECSMPVIQDSFKGAGNCIFQQDSTPCHIAKSVSTI